MHYDIRVYDDIVVPESVSTPDQMRKLKDMFELSHNLGSRVDISRIIGTRYHFSDLFNDLKEQGGWIFREYSAEKDGKPVLLTDEELNKKKTQMGSYTYACQMLLNPVKSDDAVFKNVRFQYFTEQPKFKDIAILVDPAIAKAGCYSVIMAVGITDEHDIYLIDYISKVGLKPQEQADAIYRLAHKYHTRKIGIEQVGYQQALKYITEDYFRDKGEYIRVDELKPHKSKNERIIALLPYFENNQVFIRHNMKEFIDEVTQFPFSKYRDHIDVFAYSLQYFKPKINDKKNEKVIKNIDRMSVIGDNRLNKFTRGELRWQKRRRVM
jgi:predicted phage terminase large subunit-like protein